jgi:CBS domain-containing protein
MRIQEVLSNKNSGVIHISPDDSVFDAIKKMAEHNIGALLVLDNGKLCGIISERDYRNKVILMGRTSKDTLVKEIMTNKVIFVSPDFSVDNCLSIMTNHKIRHLPVLENESDVVGVISIGDLVKAVIEEKTHEIEDLKSYITGGYMY